MAKRSSVYAAPNRHGHINFLQQLMERSPASLDQNHRLADGAFIVVTDHAIDQYCRRRALGGNGMYETSAQLQQTIGGNVRDSEGGSRVYWELLPWLNHAHMRDDGGPLVYFHRASRMVFLGKLKEQRDGAKLVVIVTCFRAVCRCCRGWPCDCRGDT